MFDRRLYRWRGVSKSIEFVQGQRAEYVNRWADIAAHVPYTPLPCEWLLACESLLPTWAKIRAKRWPGTPIGTV